MGVSAVVARNWWLRTPNPNNANNERNVNTTGVLNNNNANNGIGATADRAVTNRSSRLSLKAD